MGVHNICRNTCFAVTLGRGGSKGLPGKNVRQLGGHPLIAWSVAAGVLSSCADRVLVSTDDEEIAACAVEAGADALFRRPSYASSDSATDLDVMQHLLDWLSDNIGFLPEFIVQLRPTTPFREPSWIDDAVNRMKSDTSITCIRSVIDAPISPYKMWRHKSAQQIVPLLEMDGVNEPFNMPRQSLPEALWHTGQLDVIRTDAILTGSMTGDVVHSLKVSKELAVDIDDLLDFEFAELVFEKAMPIEYSEYLAVASKGINRFESAALNTSIKRIGSH